MGSLKTELDRYLSLEIMKTTVDTISLADFKPVTLKLNGMQLRLANASKRTVSNNYYYDLKFIALQETTEYNIVITLKTVYNQSQITPSQYSIDSITKSENELTVIKTVEINSPAGATSGTLTEEQMDLLKLSDNNIIKFNNEIYYKNDDEHTEGVLVYTHTGFTEADGGATIKYIKVTISTAAWVLTVQNISSGGGGGSKLYLHIINISSTAGLIKDPNNNSILINSLQIYIICSSATALETWDDYVTLLTKDQPINDSIYVPFTYDNEYPGSTKVIISTVNFRIFNGSNSKDTILSVRYYPIGSTNENLSSNQSTIAVILNYQKSKIKVIPLG